MPIRKVVQTVALWREGKRVIPEVGKPFDFTKAELDQITGLNPDAVVKIDNGATSGSDQLVTKTQAELDAERDEAVAAAIAQFKKEQGITDAPAKNDTGAGGAAADKGAKSDKNDKGAKSATAGKDAGSDDDI